MGNTISVVVIDDEVLIATALRHLCSGIIGVEVLDIAFSGWAGLKLVERLQPTVALVDMLMPDLSGLDLSAQITQQKIQTRVVGLTGSPDGNLCSRAREAGVKGYLLKLSAAEELSIAIHAAANGRIYVTPAMSEYFWRQPDASVRLTLRQREVLQLIVGDKSNKEIAAILEIEVKTVEKHRAEMKRRFGVAGTAGLVSSAIRSGVIHVPPN